MDVDCHFSVGSGMRRNGAGITIEGAEKWSEQRWGLLLEVGMSDSY